MTTIQNIQTPTVHINTNALAKAAFTGLALVGTAALVALVVAVVAFAGANVTGAIYFFVLVATVAAIAAVGIRENANEAKKTLYDIR